VHAVLSRRMPEFVVKRRQRDRFRQRFLPDQCSGKVYCIYLLISALVSR
jgi:hypothetical protein